MPDIIESGTSTPAPAASSVPSAQTTAVQALEKASAASSEASAPAATPAGTPVVPGGTSVPTPTAATTVQPGVPPVKPTADAPEPRIVRAVQNARAEVESKYSWAKDVDPKLGQDALSLQREIGTDAKAFVARLAGELGLQLVDPKSAPKAPASTPASDEEIRAALRSEDGKLSTYSDEQIRQLLDRERAKTLQEFEGRFKPLEDERRTAQENQEASQRAEANRKFGEVRVQEAEKLPHFKENKPEILTRMRELSLAQVKEMGGPVAAMLTIHNEILAEKVFPAIDTAAEERVRKENARKAASSAGVHPSGPAAAEGKPALKNVNDLAAHMRRLAEAQATQ